MLDISTSFTGRKIVLESGIKKKNPADDTINEFKVTDGIRFIRSFKGGGGKDAVCVCVCVYTECLTSLFLQ